MSVTRWAVGIGSAALSTTISTQLCSAADAGTVQSHSSTAGRIGTIGGAVTAAPIDFHFDVGSSESAGNLAQKSLGRGGSPVLASVYWIFTIASFAASMPRLCT